MGQEFFIKSRNLESKIRELLPSQGGQGAGFDLSASTQIVPIVDLTESAEGSNLRQDLQTSLSFSCTEFFVQNATNTVLVNNTGYFRVFGRCGSASTGNASFNLFDGATSKDLINFGDQGGTTSFFNQYDFIVFLRAGDSLRASSNSTGASLLGVTRQIATITGELVDP